MINNKIKWSNYSHVDIKSRGNNSTFIESSNQFNYNFVRSVVINDFEFSDVSYKLIYLKLSTTIYYLPCFYITFKNLITTLETGLTMTYFYPAFSALRIVLKQSANTLTLTIFECTFNLKIKYFYFIKFYKIL